MQRRTFQKATALAAGFLVRRLAAFVLVLLLPLPINGAETSAIPTTDFLNSVGIDCTFPDRGQPIGRTIEMINYLGFRWVRGGIEGLTTNGPTTLQTYLSLHEKTGVRFSWGLVSGGTDLKKLLETARELSAADALLAFEGNNEPNNWGVTYQGERGGGRTPSWLPVARLQRDLYQAVKSDPVLQRYPVWSITENGAEADNVGLQFLTIPKGAGTLMPEGTRFADYANVHNYIYHPNSAGLADNKTWNAADPTSACKVDGLYGNYGRTWAHHYAGYSEAELLTLPRVTTETGCQIGDAITEEIHALNLLSMYLDQFKRGWSYTSVYLLRDRTDEGGNQQFGFYRPDYTPRKAALYLHNLTTILTDKGTVRRPGKLSYTISDQPATVHDLLLENSAGLFQLVIWGERVEGTDLVTVCWNSVRGPVKVYDPTVGTEPVQIHTNISALTLTLSDHPLIIALPIDDATAGLPAQAGVVDPRGEPAGPLEFTGVNLAGGEFGDPAPGVSRPYGTKYIYPSPKELDYFAAKGVNIIRFPFWWADLQPNLNQPLDQTSLERIKSVAAEATRRGLVIILDPHDYARCYGKVIGSPELPKETFADFWSRLAAPFKDNSRVWFGLMNEPHDLPAEQWLAAANGAIAAIRGAGATNLVLVPGIAWTGAHSWVSSRNGEVMLKIVDVQDHYLFEVHQYLDKDNSGTKPEVVSPTIGSERLKQFTAWCREHHRRAFLGEFGAAKNEMALQAIGDMLHFMEQSRDVWAGFTWWAAGPWWGDYMFSLEPKAGQDRPQMSVLRPHLQQAVVGASGDAKAGER